MTKSKKVAQPTQQKFASKWSEADWQQFNMLIEKASTRIILRVLRRLISMAMTRFENNVVTENLSDNAIRLKVRGLLTDYDTAWSNKNTQANNTAIAREVRNNEASPNYPEPSIDNI